MIDLTEAAASILTRGPDRVVISAEGEATSSLRARRDHGVMPDVIFVRDDGWSLGAPEKWEDVARRQWPKEWVGVMRRPEICVRPLGGAGA